MIQHFTTSRHKRITAEPGFLMFSSVDHLSANYKETARKAKILRSAPLDGDVEESFSSSISS